MSDPVTPDLCPVGMEFPVDVLDSVRQEEEEQAAEGYMTQLRYVSPDKAESFTLPSHRMVVTQTHLQCYMHGLFS